MYISCYTYKTLPYRRGFHNPAPFWNPYSLCSWRRLLNFVFRDSASPSSSFPVHCSRWDNSVNHICILFRNGWGWWWWGRSWSSSYWCCLLSNICLWVWPSWLHRKMFKLPIHTKYYRQKSYFQQYFPSHVWKIQMCLVNNMPYAQCRALCNIMVQTSMKAATAKSRVLCCAPGGVVRCGAVAVVTPNPASHHHVTRWWCHSHQSTTNQ